MNPILLGVIATALLVAFAIVIVIIEAMVTFVLDNWGVILITVALGVILFGVIPAALRLWR